MTMISSRQPWNRPCLFFVFPLAVAIVCSCICITEVLHSKQDLLALVDPGLYKIGVYQVYVGTVTVISLLVFVFVVLTNFTKLLRLILIYQELLIFLCFVIMLNDLAMSYPSVSEDQELLHDAFQDYGKDDRITKMLNGTQTELECCGVMGQNDWKQATVDYLDIEFASRGVSNVSISCATTYEGTNISTTEGFHLEGCLFPFYNFKMHAYEILLFNLLLLSLFEVFCFLLIDSILDSFMASDPVVIAKCTEDENAPTYNKICVYTVISPPPKEKN